MKIQYIQLHRQAYLQESMEMNFPTENKRESVDAANE